VKRTLGKILAPAFLVTGTVLLVGMVIFRLSLDRPVREISPGRTVTVPRGASLNQVAHLLEKEGIIDNGERFSLWVRLKGLENQLKYGEYYFEGESSIRDIIETLVSGKTVLHRLTIPEGFNIRQIARRVESQKLGIAEDFLAASRRPELLSSLGIPGTSMEGFCFPDTYLLPEDWPAEKILEMMVLRFWEAFDDDFRHQSAKLGMTLLETVTLASIIEKESSHREELTTISAVFHNRLKRGIPLMADPAVIYGLEGFNGNLTKEDLERPGPYNLYKRKGLPPGPIANPGLQALEAALFPAESDYLYFVSKNNGTHHFSRSLKEHNRAVNLYQKGQN
jgi:UPF0755 protein